MRRKLTNSKPFPFPGLWSWQSRLAIPRPDYDQSAFCACMEVHNETTYSLTVPWPIERPSHGPQVCLPSLIRPSWKYPCGHTQWCASVVMLSPGNCHWRLIITGCDSLTSELCTDRLLPFLVLCGRDCSCYPASNRCWRYWWRDGMKVPCSPPPAFLPSARNLQELRVHSEKSFKLFFCNLEQRAGGSVLSPILGLDQEKSPLRSWGFRVQIGELVEMSDTLLFS